MIEESLCFPQFVSVGVGGPVQYIVFLTNGLDLFPGLCCNPYMLVIITLESWNQKSEK